MLTENQQTVYDWINDELELPVYAEAYKGAIEQLNNKSSGYITFVSHTGRDIMNLLAAASITSEEEQNTSDWINYTEHVEGFKNDWIKELGGDGYDTQDSDEKRHIISNEVFKKINELVDEHIRGNLAPLDKANLFFISFLNYPKKENIQENLYKEWKMAKECFEKSTHLRKEAFTTEQENEVKMQFQYLDNLLYNAAESLIEKLRSIDEILDRANR